MSATTGPSAPASSWPVSPTASDENERHALTNELAAVNMPIADSVVSRYRSRGVATEDLQQVAYLALTKAARRFDPSAGHDFLSFCVPTIRGEVRRYFRDKGWMVRPPRRIQELQARISQAQRDLSITLGRPPVLRRARRAPRRAAGRRT